MKNKKMFPSSFERLSFWPKVFLELEKFFELNILSGLLDIKSVQYFLKFQEGIAFKGRLMYQIKILFYPICLIFKLYLKDHILLTEVFRRKCTLIKIFLR